MAPAKKSTKKKQMKTRKTGKGGAGGREPHFTVAELCAYWSGDVKAETVRTYAKTGQLPGAFRMPNGAYRIPAEAVRVFENARLVVALEG
ncbi:hypothetical protein BVY04_03900 [bacterium M21]|nr:hypothetical protein BVY04_03900 [bacterium M21]